jgi:hypothetical protein
MSANEPFLIISERFNLLALQQDDSFKSLDQTLQAFVNNLANGYRSPTSFHKKVSLPGA